MINVTVDDRNELYVQVEHCKKILKSLGIIPSEMIDYEFGDKRHYGTYCYNRSAIEKRVISINHTYFKYAINNNIEQLRNTIIHEMLHDVANDIEFRCGHCGAWKILANKVSRNTNYKITTNMDKEFQKIYNAYLFNTSQNQFNSNKAYYVICNDCGKVLTVKKKKSKIIDAIMRNTNRYSCGLCKSPNLIVEYK